MEGANKFEPNEIPNMIALLSTIFSERRSPTSHETVSINSFFMRYMGKAMDDCKAASDAHWQVARHSGDIAFKNKEVVVKGIEENLYSQFVVATTATFVSDKKQYDEFRQYTQDTIINHYGDDDEYVTIFNNLVFNAPMEVINGKRSLVRALWIGCRLSKAHFVQDEPAANS